MYKLSSLLFLILFLASFFLQATAANVVNTNGNYTVTFPYDSSPSNTYKVVEIKDGVSTYEILEYTRSWSRVNQTTGAYEYRYQVCTEEFNSSSGELEATCDGLFQPFDTYTVVRTPSSLFASPTTSGTNTVTWSVISGATQYELQQQKGTGNWVTVYSGSATNKVMAGLTTDNYTYRVRAKYNSVLGVYKTSAVSTIVRTPETITVPTTDSDGAFTVSWSSVTGASSYELQQRKGNGSWITVYSGTNTSKALSGLENHNYSYRVRSKLGNVAGDYKSSPTVNVVKIPTNITTPSVDTDGNFAVSWATVSGATGYVLQQKKGNGSWSTIYSGTATYKNISNLTIDTYYYRVLSKFGSLSSAYLTSQPTSIVITPSSINVPESDTNGAFTVSWSAVSGATTYELQQLKGSGSWETIYTGVATSYAVSGLENNNYQYRIRATLGAATSDYKVSTVVNVIKSPSNIVTPSTDIDGTYTVSWSAVSGATGYVLQERKGSGNWVELYSGTATSKSISGRKTNYYTYRVASKFNGISSDYKTSTNTLVLITSTILVPINVGDITTFIPIPDPSKFNVRIEGNQFALSWPVEPNTTHYVLEHKVNGVWVELNDELYSNSTTTSLDNGPEFRILACNANGCFSVSGNENLDSWKALDTVEVVDAGGENEEPTDTVNLDAIPLKGKASTSNGQASYQVPIDLPPGRDGVQPNVSLAYTSQSSNGLLGVGWSLNANASISRCAPTYEQDPTSTTRSVTFNAAEDRLCLNGQRLVVVNEVDYGEHDAVYRTEMDSFIKVVQSGHINSNTSSFIAYHPDGSYVTYGADDNSRVKVNRDLIQSWKIAQTVKSSGANVIEYEYIVHGTNEHLLSTIYYTGTTTDKGNRKVVFTYENRSDTQSGTIDKYKFDYTQRLNKVSTFVGDRAIQHYYLNYNYSQYSDRSILASIIRCGFYDDTEQCSPATTFNWLDQPATFKAESTPVDSQQSIHFAAPSGDLNGDGVIDWAGYNVNAEGDFIANTNEINDCFTNEITTKLTCTSADFNLDGISDSIFLSKDGVNPIKVGLSVDGVADWQDTDIVVSGGLSSIVHIGDLNGDAYPDLVVNHYSTLESEVYFYPNNQTDIPFSNDTRELITTLNNQGATQTNLAYVGDMDGNGIGDFMYYIGTSEGNYSGFQPSALWLTKITNTGILGFSKKTLNFEANSYYNTPANYGWVRFQVLADVNGDGLPDWLGFYKPNENYGRLFVRFNTIGNFGAPIDTGVTVDTRQFIFNRTYDIDGQADVDIKRQKAKHSNSYRVIDLDGDGKDEIIFPETMVAEACYNVRGYETEEKCGEEIFGTITNTSLHSFRSIDERYDYNVYQYGAITFKNGSFTKYTPDTIYGTSQHTTVVDGFGNGLSDIVFSYGCGTSDCSYPSSTLAGFEQGKLNVNRNYGAGNGVHGGDYQPYDYMVQATDGIGNAAQWRYRPLASSENSAGQAFYPKGYQHIEEGYLHFTSSMYAVQSFKQSNAIGGYNEMQYAYQGATYHPQGRGFTGFKQIVSKDIARNKTTTSTYKLTFPETGLLESQTVAVGSTTVTQITNQWQLNPQHTIAGVYHNVNTSALQQNYDLGSGLLHSSIEQSIGADKVDEWGNVTEHKRIVVDYLGSESNTYSTLTTTTYDVDENNWWLRKYNAATVTAKVDDRGWTNDPAYNNDNIATTQTHTTTVNTWDTTHKKPKKLTTTASGSACSMVVQTTYNGHGLPSSITQTGQNSSCNALAVRTTSFTYTKDGSKASADGYLPYTVTNAKNHKTTNNYDMAFGQLVKVTDPNAIVINTQLDALGKPLSISKTGSPTQYIRYLLAHQGSYAPTHAVAMVRTTSAGSPVAETYIDQVGRTLREASESFNGSYQFIDKVYDGQGNVIKESLPYIETDSVYYTEFSHFDALNRPATRKLPHGLTSTYSYNGLTTNINVGSPARTMSRTYSSQGWLLETQDALDGTNRFSYDAAGKPLIIQDANANQIKATYNGFGHKTQVDDSNRGIVTFGYNTFGELDEQVDATGVTQSYLFDTLGRITQRSTLGGSNPSTATYTWDTTKKGLLSSESENAITRSYQYNSTVQISQSTVNVDNKNYTIKHQYDGFYGRPKALEYPNGLTVAYTYNTQGYLTHTSNAASDYVYQHITEMDAAGHITGAELGSNILSQVSVYNQDTGTMHMTSVNNAQGSLHSHYYDVYDDYLNIRSERNGATGLEKSYNYDVLNRLTTYSFSNTSPAISASINYAYDAVGNLLKKNDYSKNNSNAYQYGGSAACASNSNAGSNAVCLVEKLNNTSAHFRYDNKGNLISGDGLTITYNAMDKPLQVNGRGANTQFSYGSDHMRAKQVRTVGTSTTTTHYIDKLYEIDNDGSWRAYIKDAAVLSYTPTRKHQLMFTLRDRLGSATTLADHNGQVVSRRYFDPFGRSSSAATSHSSDMANGNVSLSKFTDLTETNRYRRGFTDHEHLNEQQLIHMNGRMYDYNIGRFVSIDPFIQAPSSTQSVNPYSYIMNNPLAGTDPTGYRTSCTVKTGSSICRPDQAKISVKKIANVKVTPSEDGKSATVAVTTKSGRTITETYKEPKNIGSQGSQVKGSTSGAVKSGSDDENSFVNSNRKGLDSALAKVNGLRDKLDPFETEEEAAVWLNDNAGNLQEKYGAEVGAVISKVYGEKTGWKIGDVVTSYHSNYVNLATSKIRAGKMDYIDTSIKGKSDWHTHSSGSHYASWGQDRDSHKSFYRAYVSSVGRSGKASLSLYNAPAARKEAWPLTRTAFDNANSCLAGECR